MIVGPAFVWLRRIGLTALTAFVVVPLYAMTLTAFLPSGAAQDGFTWLPHGLTLAAFRDMWSTIPLTTYLRNSVVVSVTATLLAVTFAVPAGWCLARRRFLGRGTIASVLVITQTVSGLLFLVPTALLISEIDRRFGLTLQGSLVVLIVTELTFALPFSVGLLASHWAATPAEMEESAYDLGAGPVTTLVKVVVPTSWPVIGVVAVFAFGLSWGEVMFASALSDSDSRTLAVGLSGYTSESGVLWNQLTAAGILASAPVVLAFVAVRRHLVAALGGADRG